MGRDGFSFPTSLEDPTGYPPQFRQARRIGLDRGARLAHHGKVHETVGLPGTAFSYNDVDGARHKTSGAAGAGVAPKHGARYYLGTALLAITSLGGQARPEAHRVKYT